MRTLNYLGDGRTVTSVIETYICTKQKIMSIMCLFSVWESQLCLLKNVLKSSLYNNEVHFLSTWSVCKQHAPATPLLLGHACRKCHVPLVIETRVVTMPCKITPQQHDIVWKPLSRCCFWLTLDSALRRSSRQEVPDYSPKAN